MLKAKALCTVQNPEEPEITAQKLASVNPASREPAPQTPADRNPEPDKPAPQTPEAQSPAPEKAENAPASGIGGLIGGQQNMVIETFVEQEEIQPCIASLAMLLVQKDTLMKGFIRMLRQQYLGGNRSFSFSLGAWSREERQQIYQIFAEELCGLVDSVRLDRYSHVLSGNLIFTGPARGFLTGQYMEIGVFEIIRLAMEELAKTYNTEYRIYRNVRVTTKMGLPKNEFDIVIECQGHFYVVEVKSGGQFNSWGSLLEVGKAYGIVPHRLLLVDSYLTEEKAGRIETFCEYYAANLEDGMVRRKIMQMVGADLKKGE